MVLTVFTLSIWLARTYVVILLILAIYFCRRPYNPVYMRTFPIYCLGNLLSEIFAIAFPQKIDLIYSLFTCFELVYFAYFLTTVTVTVWLKRFVWILVGLCLGFLSILLYRQDLGHVNLWASLLESIILVIPCLSYFHGIFLRKHVVNLPQEPSFWMVTGVLFYMFLQIPVVLFASYGLHHLSDEFALELYSGNNYALIVTYTLFIKAMTCRRKIYH